MKRTVFRRAAAWAALLGALSLFTSCAGTSSGVDNPSLTISFTDGNGLAARVTGDLYVYASDQNPAVDPRPLATHSFKNSAFAVLSDGDFQSAQTAASKLAAARIASGAGDRTRFNIILKTGDGKGGIALGLAFDSATGAFTWRDSAVRTVSLQPQALIRYAARVAKEEVHGEDCRVFVPGTPFLATLVDSVFVIEGLPQGVLPLRLIGSDGKIYPIADSLNTADSAMIYRPSSTPSGSLDTVHSGDSIPDFQVFAPPPHDAYVGQPDHLAAKLSGISESDPRLSFHWKWLPDTLHPADTLPHGDPGAPKPPPGPQIATAAALGTDVLFPGEGVFKILFSATVGTRIRSDTALIYVHVLPPPEPRVIRPAPAETLMLGHEYTVQWEMPAKGPYTLEVSTNNGEKWGPIASHYLRTDGLQIFAWTPSPDLGNSDRCLLRIRDEKDTNQVAITPDFFHLLH